MWLLVTKNNVLSESILVFGNVAFLWRAWHGDVLIQKKQSDDRLNDPYTGIVKQNRSILEQRAR